jgi:hypothetical protein
MPTVYRFIGPANGRHAYLARSGDLPPRLPLLPKFHCRLSVENHSWSAHSPSAAGSFYPRSGQSCPYPLGDSEMFLFCKPLAHAHALLKRRRGNGARQPCRRGRHHRRAGQFRVVRAEAFNLLNSPQFGIPQRLLEGPEFGQEVRTITPALGRFKTTTRSCVFHKRRLARNSGVEASGCQ